MGAITFWRSLLFVYLIIRHKYSKQGFLVHKNQKSKSNAEYGVPLSDYTVSYIPTVLRNGALKLTALFYSNISVER